ncbi:hypothetical protein ACHAPU_000776 [Fusarium lateritium]
MISAEVSHAAAKKLYGNANRALEDAKKTLEDAKASLKIAKDKLSSAVVRRDNASEARRRLVIILDAHEAIQDRDKCRQRITQMEVEFKGLVNKADPFLDQIRDGDLESVFGKPGMDDQGSA